MVLLPWPKAMTAGGATRQKAAKTAIIIATRKPSPVRSFCNMAQAYCPGLHRASLATDHKLDAEGRP